MYKQEKTQLEKKLETQKVFDYCLYMMLTSYFKSSVCKNKQLEKRMFLYYKEYNVNKVYEMEERVIKDIEEMVLPIFSKEELEGIAEVWLVPNRERGCIETLLHTLVGYTRVSGIYKGKETSLEVSRAM